MNDKGNVDINPPQPPAIAERFGQLFVATLIVHIIFATFWFNPFPWPTKTWSHPTLPNPYTCTPPPISVEFLGALSSHNQDFDAAKLALDSLLSLRSQADDIDSMAIAIVTPSDVIFQKTYGALKANETLREKRSKPDENTLYRVASISKMFTAMEMMLLREEGVLSLDDHVTRFLPNFTHPSAGWDEYLDTRSTRRRWKSKSSPVTLRQLASYMSGIGREYPPAVIKGYPHVNPNTPMELVSYTQSEIMHSIATLPLVAEQYTYPIYSDTGYNLLGWALVAAANKTSSFAELIQHDIFSPLGLSSSFNVTKDNVKNVAISRIPEEADIDFGEGGNPAIGQFSSLRDLTTVMQTFLDPWNNEKALLSPEVIREWTRPLHGWDDGLSEVGLAWQITKIPDSNGVPRRFFGKGGDMNAYHSYFTFDPIHASFGVIVLMTGNYGAGDQISNQAIRSFQPVFDRVIARAIEKLYAGRWESDDKKSVAVTYVSQGNLWLRQLVLDGVDAFELRHRPGHDPLPKDTRYGLWTTGRKDEFRVAFGLPEPNHTPLWGCSGAWGGIDSAYSSNAPIDLILFGVDMDEGRIMRIPSSGTILKRKY